jgi:putative FmdB family regulatory protein
MPIYEFKCNACGNTFEEIVFGSDQDSDFGCPTCGDEDTCRLMSSFSCGSGNAGGGLGKDLGASCGPSGGGFS